MPMLIWRFQPAPRNAVAPLSISEEVEAKISDSDRAVGLELFATAAAPRSA
jgi:hypothetical protein